MGTIGCFLPRQTGIKGLLDPKLVIGASSVMERKRTSVDEDHISTCRAGAAKTGANQACNRRDSMQAVQLKTSIQTSKISLERQRAGF